ncbi:MAG: VWA domain-containing protein [Deltaproteobacteria bacterium]|nr:VWA domain-containing protein [Deltaproteobacteria bacterium]
MSMIKSRWLSGAGCTLIVGAIAAACGGSGDPLFEGAGAAAGSGGAAGTGGAGGAGGTTNDASAGTGGVAGSAGKAGGATGGAAGTGGSSPCGSCDDGVSCTVDSCKGNKCVHEPDSKLCQADYTCDPLTGCIPSMACATTADCEKKLGGDACKTDIKCDPSKSICTWQALDKDKDGSAPVVCGGKDCDDNDATVHPGASDTCDGKDNDCSGKIDDGATCPGLQKCTSGACVCPADNQCGSECVDKNADPNHCGSCGNACPSAATCKSGTCVCDSNATICSGTCVDLNVDPNNCGTCNAKCATGYSCQNKTCLCAKTPCNGQCIDTASDPYNCGACNHACGAGQTCSSGQCWCPGNVPACNGACPDFSTDPNNCGACGTKCTGGKSCVSGGCVCTGGLTDCSGACVNLANNDNNCGACGTKCALPTKCTNSVCSACPTTDLVILLDESGSTMTTFTNTSITRLQAMVGAAKAFIAEPASANIGVGMQYFPLSTNSCVVSDFAKPAIAVDLLSVPAQLTALNQWLDAQVPTAATPMAVALQGVLQYSKARAQGTGHRVAVVMLTDGIPNDCGTNPSTIDAVNAVQPYAAGTPKVPTYVVGVGDPGQSYDWTPADWNQIAAAGGTGQFYEGKSQAEILADLDAIRTAFATCP